MCVCFLSYKGVYVLFSSSNHLFPNSTKSPSDCVQRLSSTDLHTVSHVLVIWYHYAVTAIPLVFIPGILRWDVSCSRRDVWSCNTPNNTPPLQTTLGRRCSYKRTCRPCGHYWDFYDGVLSLLLLLLLLLCSIFKSVAYIWLHNTVPGPLFTKTPSYGYRDPHYKPKTVWRPSHVL